MKPNSRVKIQDEHTGEQVHEVPVFFQPKQRNGFQQWSQIRCLQLDDQKDAHIMNQIKQLHGEAARVLLAIQFTNGYRNHVSLTQGQLARLLGMARQNVNRAFRELANMGFLRREQAENQQIWVLSEQLVWRGRANEHLKLVK